MNALAIMSQQKAEYGPEAPFDGVTKYILIGLHHGTRNNLELVKRRMQSQIDKDEAVGVMQEKFFAPIEPRKPVDEIAIELAEKYGGRFYGAMCSAGYVAGYVAFRIEEQAKAYELFDSL